MKQLQMNVNGSRWGGRREGAGRKRIHSTGVSHRKRERITRHTPVHITIKYSTRIRNKAFLEILKRAILSAQSKNLRIIHYSVQSDHIHFIIEANGNRKLTAGMRSLSVTLARGLNDEHVQVERYHLHVLRNPVEVKNAVRYVVFNEEKHSGKRNIDSYSSVSRYLKLQFDLCITELDDPKSFLLSSQSS